MLAKAIISYFKYELQNLKQHPDQIDSQKEVWLQIAKDLGEEKILSENQQEQFISQVNDIYNLNGFWMFIQWLGCTLSAIVVFPLWFDCIRNRIIHPENRCIFERLQDKKNELIAPLQEFVNPQKNNKHDIK